MKQNGMRPQDIVILLKIITIKGQNWIYKDLSKALEISMSEISDALKRNSYAGLFNPDTRKVNRLALMDFLIHGIKYVFPQVPGPVLFGLPTAHSHPYYKDRFVSQENYVWPFVFGTVRGQAVEPLYHNVPKAVLLDETLYFLLASIDILRVGKAREKELAIENLKNIVLNEPSSE